MNVSSNRVLPSRRPRTFRGLIGRLVAWISVLALTAVACAGLLWFFATSNGPLDKPRIVDIPLGSSTIDIATRLHEHGVVDNSIVTMLGITAVRYAFEIEVKAGEYEFAAGSSLVDVLRKIKSGQTVVYKVSMPEGFTSWQVMERLNANDVLVGVIEEHPAEGTLLPDTYLFNRGGTRQSIIERMRSAQKKFVEDLWPTRAEGLPFKTPQEALVLASIVEKETGKADERAHVAAVFINRLRKGMRLQSDPTIIYGITNGQGKLGRPLSRSDIREETDFNTYQINGLPPTPIANPGRASIKAVLNPVATDDLYFVADGTGGHVFAKTLAQHNANVRKWRSWLKTQREQQEPEEETEGRSIADSESSEADAAQPAAVEQYESLFRVVIVAGRSVPIPKDRPQRQ